MMAIVYARYGMPEVLQLLEVDQPVPKDDEVLLRIDAASLNKVDYIMLRGRPLVVRPMASGLWRPKTRILGSDVAGRVEAVGTNVKRFRPGDEVFGNLSRSGRGALAEHACAREDALTIKPSNISFEQAAAVPLAAGTALLAVRDLGRVQPGQKVLVYGASGGVGTFAVQIAKALGAEVTAVSSTKHAEVTRSIGADQVLDYTKEGFELNGRQYDLIVGVNGYQPLWGYRRALSPQGTYVMVGGSGPQIFQALILGPLLSRSKGKRMVVGSWKPDGEYLSFLSRLLETGQIVPVIDRRYPLHEAAEAFRYLGEGHAGGKVVITMD
jgi:NADPH:quinone reductase-like Zn-dependent oxidoreductase